MSAINELNMLRVGTILHGTYKIESYLSSGGFGNTYLAKNIEFDETYAIKEFFVKGVCQRDVNSTTVSVSNAENTNSFEQQREKFKKEARRLRSLSNPHIVKVYDLFEENGTAYYVMDYVDGENLSVRLKRINAPLAESEVRNYLNQILDGLEAIHNEGMFHLDIKPANIMVDSHNVVKLIDFGASKQQSTVGGATMSTGISYTNGYAPSEQMAQSYDKFGPWTDFYALGATMYKLLTNQDPPSVSDLSEDETEDKHLALPMPHVSEEMKKLVVWMMQEKRLKRPQNVAEFKTKKIEKVHFNTQPSSSRHFSTNEDTLYLNSKRVAKDNSLSKSIVPTKNSKVKGLLITLIIVVGIIGSLFVVFWTNQKQSATANQPNNRNVDTAISENVVAATSAAPKEDDRKNETLQAEVQKSYQGTDIGEMIKEFLSESNNGEYGVDFGLFSSNSSLKQMEDNGSEYDNYGSFGAIYRGKFSIMGMTLSNSSTRECNMYLKGPHAGAMMMIINVGSFNDNYEDKIRNSIIKTVSGKKLKTYNQYPVRDDFYHLGNGYMLIHLDIGASGEYMTIYVSGEKSSLQQIMNLDEDF